MKKYLGLALMNLGGLLLASGAYVLTAIIIASRTIAVDVNFWTVLPIILGGLSVIAGIISFGCSMKHEKEHSEHKHHN